MNSASTKTPTAATFYQVDGSPIPPSSGGFISLMDSQPLNIGPVPVEAKHVARGSDPDSDDDDDLGLGNSKGKAQEQQKEQPKEEPKPQPEPEKKPAGIWK